MRCVDCLSGRSDPTLCPSCATKTRPGYCHIALEKDGWGRDIRRLSAVPCSSLPRGEEIARIRDVGGVVVRSI